MRLFIAFELPDAWRRAAADAQDALRRAVEPRVLRFVDPERMHLTLRFIGEAEEDTPDRLCEQLGAAVAAVDVTLTLGAPGTFGPPARTTVAWLGVDGDRDALAALIAAIETAVTGAGVPPETRPFRPHLTLARVARTASPEQRRAIAAGVERLDPPPPAPTRFREIALVRSHLGGPAPRYEVLARHPGAR